MPFPPSKNRATPVDPNAAAVNAEDSAKRAAAAAVGDNASDLPETYTKHSTLTESKVKAQTVSDRGQKHTRS